MKTRISKRIIPMIMALALVCVSIPMVAKADASKVVTLGANLSEDQVASMYEYFGTTADEVETIIVTNTDERKYMEGIASEEQIGTRTYSCSYVEPTDSGGIQVKVANLTFVTSSMIASTLLTAGMENCNVVAASPIAVSGTGALTGIMMAYESASGETLSEEQKEAATEELVTTGELADEIGQEEASDVMNDIKETVIGDGLTDADEIASVVSDAVESYNVSNELEEKITALMQEISQYDYDVNALKDTMDNLSGKSEGFFAGIWNTITGFFGGSSSGDGGIINDTDDSVLGTNVVTDSTVGSSASGSESIWERITNFFENLFDSIFHSNEEAEEADEEVEDEPLTEEEEQDEQDEQNEQDEQDGAQDETEDNGVSDITIITEDTQTFSADDGSESDTAEENAPSETESSEEDNGEDVTIIPEEEEN